MSSNEMSLPAITNRTAEAAKEMLGRYFPITTARAAPQHRLYRSIGFITPQQKWEEVQVVYDSTFSENLSS
jgi:putative transposase